MPRGFFRTVRRPRALVVPLLVTLLALGLSGPAARAAGVGAPTGLSPDSVAVDGTPVLAWDRVATATSYSVEVSASSSFDTLLWSTSTINHRAVPNRELDAGTVYWRVRAVADSGTGPWASASFDRDALAGPTLVGPSPGTVLQQPGEPPLLSWSPTPGATAYTVQVGTDAAFTDPLQYDEYSTKVSAFVVPDPQVAQGYYWRVRATLGNGVLTQWSQTGDYEVAGLSAPVLQSPADSPSTDVEDVVLDWEPVLGAKTYNLQVSTDQNFSDTNLDVNATGIVGTRYSPPVTLANDQYFWRVQPVDAQGNTLAWPAVETWTFRRHWPDQPSLEYPADDAVVGDPFFYQWTPVHLASEYTVQISATSDFNVLAGSCSTVQTTFVPRAKSDCYPTALGTYYWRVVATDGPGQTHQGKDIVTDAISAEVGRFTYDPGMVSQLSPAPGASVAVPTLRWSPVAGAEAYKVTITAVTDGDGDGSWTTTGTSFTPRALLTVGKSYRWQVQTVSTSGRLGAGLLQGAQPTFTVAAATATPGSTPEPSGPPAPSSRFPTLSWSPVTDATGYKIRVRPVGSAGWTELSDRFAFPAGEDDTEAHLTPGNYEWAVDAYQGSVWMSASTTTSTFTITPLGQVQGQHVALTGTALSSPGTSCDLAIPDTCAELRQTPVLSWDADPDAGSYLVWLANDKQMTNLVQPAVRVEGTAYVPVDALADSQAGSAYYWSVQPCKTKTVCAAPEHARHAFNLLSKPVQLLTPTQDESKANEITFTWRDYLATAQDPTTSPPASPNGTHAVQPRVEARQYRVQVATSTAFQAPLLANRLVDQTTFTSFAETYPEGPLYWRVQALDGSGNGLSWSGVGRFTKSSPQVTLSAPINGVQVGGSLPFRWQPLPYAASYDIEAYKNTDTTGSTTNRILTANSKQVAYTPTTPLPAAVEPYTWRVRPVDAKGRPGPWTDLAAPSARFTVVGSAPTLLDPAPDVLVPAKEALFTWTAVDGATSYKFERRLVGATTSAETVTTPAQAWAARAAVADGAWQWRVSSLDAAGKVQASSPWRGFLVDGTSPKVTDYSPQSTARRSANFVVRFSEPVVLVNGRTFKLTLAGKSKALAARVTLNAVGTKATLNPTVNLKVGKRYTARVSDGITDLAGNPLAPMSWQVTAR